MVNEGNFNDCMLTGNGINARLNDLVASLLDAIVQICKV